MSEPWTPYDFVTRIESAVILASSRPSTPNMDCARAATDVSPNGTAVDGAGRRNSSGENGDGADEMDLRLAQLPMTDLGNAERFAERHRHALLYCPALGWLAWDGSRWVRDVGEQHVKMAE